MVGKALRSALVSAWILAAVRASVAEGDCDTTTTTTTTIPWTGHWTTCTSIVPCPGTTTVVTMTPLWTPSCTTTTAPKPTPTPSTTTLKTTTTPKTTPKPTISTSTPTSRSSSTPAPSPSGACLNVRPGCNNYGLDVAYYGAPFVENVPPGSYLPQPVLATSLSNETYLADNFGQPPAGEFPVIYPNPNASTTEYFVGWTRVVDGGIVVNANNFTLAYQGFYRAPQTGTYSICGWSDNAAWLWFGDNNAFSCLTGKASESEQYIVEFPLFSINCASVDMVQDFYYPIRVQLTNISGESKFNMTINLPGSTGNDPNSYVFDGSVFQTNCGLYL